MEERKCDKRKIGKNPTQELENFPLDSVRIWLKEKCPSKSTHEPLCCAVCTRCHKRRLCNRLLAWGSGSSCTKPCKKLELHPQPTQPRFPRASAKNNYNSLDFQSVSKWSFPMSVLPVCWWAVGWPLRKLVALEAWEPSQASPHCTKQSKWCPADCNCCFKHM